MLSTEELGPVHRGIDLFLPPWPDVLWSAVVLLIIAFAFYRFIMPKFMSVLDQRAELIDGGIKQAEQVREAAQQTLVERHKMLEESQVEAAKTRAAARAEGEAIIAQQKEIAAQEAARIEANSQRNIEAQYQQAETTLRDQVGSLAVELAGRIVRESLSDDDKKSATVDKAIAQLEGANLMHGPEAGRVRGGFDDPLAEPTDVGVISDIGGDIGLIAVTDDDLQDDFSGVSDGASVGTGAGTGADGGVADGYVTGSSTGGIGDVGDGADGGNGNLATTVVKERRHFLRKHK